MVPLKPLIKNVEDIVVFPDSKSVNYSYFLTQEMQKVTFAEPQKKLTVSIKNTLIMDI